MSAESPPRQHPFPNRLTVLYGLVLFLWLSPEDNAVWPVTLLGGVGALLLIYHLLLRAQVALLHRLEVALVVGAVIGLATSLLTTALMFFKNALHAHVFLDYPPALMIAVLQRAPAWALVGAFIALGGALFWRAVRQPHPPT